MSDGRRKVGSSVLEGCLIHAVLVCGVVSMAAGGCRWRARTPWPRSSRPPPLAAISEALSLCPGNVSDDVRPGPRWLEGTGVLLRPDELCVLWLCDRSDFFPADAPGYVGLEAESPVLGHGKKGPSLSSPHLDGAEGVVGPYGAGAMLGPPPGGHPCASHDMLFSLPTHARC